MEIIVKINDGSSPSSYKDGDIIQAASLRQIYYCHAQHKCHVKNFPLEVSSGLRSQDPLLIKFLEKTHTYKFERVNSNDVVRTNLVTDEQKTINRIPNGYGDHINIYGHLLSLLKSEEHLIFGSSGLEFWYGEKRSDFNIDDIWNDIETHTDFLKSDHIHFPFTDAEKRMFLPMSCCMHGHEHDHTSLPVHNACLSVTCGCDLSECTNDFISERLSSIAGEVRNEGTDEQYNEIAHRRKYQVPYWDFTSTLSLNVDDIRNANKEVDLRKSLQSRPAADLLSRDKVAAGVVDG